LPVIFHKLKNKLTPILGYAQILIRKIEDDDIVQRLKKIETNANDLTEKLDQLKDYFKTEAPPKEKANLNNIINQLQDYFLSIQKLEKIKIELKLDNNLPDDFLIPGQIEALITNIFNNAVSAIKEKNISDGCIRICTKLDEKSYHLIIRDNGIGITNEEIADIWVAFYSKFPEKVGLGLTVCEKILSNHGATCRVQSQTGKFSEFNITFWLKPTETYETNNTNYNFDNEVSK
jgi:signal transduction histidine kinase